MLRHVPRVHRIDLDSLFERFRVDPGLAIRYVNTKMQIADILTKGSFTGAQWKVLCDLAQTYKRQPKIKVSGTSRETSKPLLKLPDIPDFPVQAKKKKKSSPRSNRQEGSAKVAYLYVSEVHEDNLPLLPFFASPFTTSDGHYQDRSSPQRSGTKAMPPKEELPYGGTHFKAGDKKSVNATGHRQQEEAKPARAGTTGGVSYRELTEELGKAERWQATGHRQQSSGSRGPREGTVLAHASAAPKALALPEEAWEPAAATKVFEKQPTFLKDGSRAAPRAKDERPEERPGSAAKLPRT